MSDTGRTDEERAIEAALDAFGRSDLAGYPIARVVAACRAYIRALGVPPEPAVVAYPTSLSITLPGSMVFGATPEVERQVRDELTMLTIDLTEHERDVIAARVAARLSGATPQGEQMKPIAPPEDLTIEELREAYAEGIQLSLDTALIMVAHLVANRLIPQNLVLMDGADRVIARVDMRPSGATPKEEAR